MVSQIVGFTAFIVLVLGGVCGAIVKFTLHGRVSAKVENRTNDSLWKEAMEQSHLTEAMEMSNTGASEHASNDTEQKHHHKQDGMRMSHATA